MSEARSRVADLVDAFHSVGIYRQFTRVNYPAFSDLQQERLTPLPTVLAPAGSAPLVEVEIHDVWAAIDCLPGDAVDVLGTYRLRRASVVFNRGLRRIGGQMMRVEGWPTRLRDRRVDFSTPMKGRITATHEPHRGVAEFKVVKDNLGTYATPWGAVDAFMEFVHESLRDRYDECAARGSEWWQLYLSS